MKPLLTKALPSSHTWRRTLFTDARGGVCLIFVDVVVAIIIVVIVVVIIVVIIIVVIIILFAIITIIIFIIPRTKMDLHYY